MMTEILKLEIKAAPQKMSGGWIWPYMVINLISDGLWSLEDRFETQSAAERYAATLEVRGCSHVKIIKLPDIPPEPLETP